MIVTNLGEKIKQAREQANNGLGMSQTELSKAIGINQTSLSEIEMGKTTPRKPTLIALSYVLKNDFGEQWLQEFFSSSANTTVMKFNHKEIAVLFTNADQLDEETIVEMRHIWEMVRAEISKRRK